MNVIVVFFNVTARGWEEKKSKVAEVPRANIPTNGPRPRETTSDGGRKKGGSKVSQMTTLNQGPEKKKKEKILSYAAANAANLV